MHATSFDAISLHLAFECCYIQSQHQELDHSSCLMCEFHLCVAHVTHLKVNTSLLKTTPWSLDHKIWLMLNRFTLSPSTYSTFAISNSPSKKMIPFLLSGIFFHHQRWRCHLAWIQILWRECGFWSCVSSNYYQDTIDRCS